MVNEEPKTDAEILQEKLHDITDQEGIIGYILRGSKIVTVDLKDSTKIVDYAILSSTAFDVCQSMTEILEIGEICTMLIETEEIKLLSMPITDHRLNLFMEKNVDHNKVSKNLK